jgi:hypothetical protein
VLSRRVAGRTLAAVLTRCPRCGTIRAVFRGRVVRTVSLAAPSLRKRQIILLARLPALSSGTLRLEVAGTGRPVRIEGLAVGVR